MEKTPQSLLEPLVFRDGRSLPCRIIPGPMEGISEGSFVTVMSEMCMARCWFTPFIRISNGVPRMARLREKLEPYLATGRPVIAQIMGTYPELLAVAAARLHSLGAVCVDLNCGCPSPTVIGSHSGGYHLTDPDWMFTAITAMRSACGDAAVSIKIRCGFKSIDEMEDIAAAVREASPDMVTCHFRTVKELYRPVADGLSRLAKMRSLLPDVPLIGSGDLFTVGEAVKMVRETGVDGVAPARGLIRNPALLMEIEAECRRQLESDDGVPPSHRETLSSAERFEFLERVGHLSGLPPKQRGFLLRMAREMFGEDSPEFKKLLDAIANKNQ